MKIELRQEVVIAGRDPNPMNKAQQVARLPNPYQASVASMSSRELRQSSGHENDQVIFYFDDGSWLTFRVYREIIECQGGLL